MPTYFWPILFCACVAAFAAGNEFDASGRLERLKLGEGWLEVHTNVVVATSGWKTFLSQANGTTTAHSRAEKEQSWCAHFADAHSKLAFDVVQKAREHDGNLTFHLKLTARSDAEIEGAYFWIDVPSAQFAGGKWRAGNEAGLLPETLQAEYHICELRADDFLLSSPAQAVLCGKTKHKTRIAIQDGRKWSKHFSVLVDIWSGKMPKGKSGELEITLATSGKLDETPARCTLDLTPRYKVSGIGGNYCFATESPVSDYTLQHLKVAFARTEMSAQLWMPDNDLAEDAVSRWRGRLLRDQDGSKLRREFELMSEFSRRGIPYIASIWRIPPWMYKTAPNNKHPHGHKLARERWPELLEAIGSYLLYAKEKYRGEPDYFSFNEPDIGVYVGFDAEEHRDSLKRLGAHFKKLGLKTRLLLGDVASVRSGAQYLQPAVKDPEALAYAGAVSFHSWGGGTAEQYGEWAAVAEKLKLPLIVAEAGVDASAWQDARYHQPLYAIRELAHYQELFLHARPQAILYWEYTGDYALLKTDPQDPQRPLQPTPRFAFQKHWTEFIPAGSEALTTTSNHTSVLFTAFRWKDKAGRMKLSLHLANRGWTRQVSLEGIPKELQSLAVVRSSLQESLNPAAAVKNEAGRIELELPGQSLTTLLGEWRD